MNRYVHPDHSATSQILSDLSFALAEAGVPVLLIGSRHRYDDVSARLPRHELVNGVEIVRVGGHAFGRATLIGRALDYAAYYLAAGWVLARRARRGDLVVVKTDPPLLSVVAGPIARLRGARVVNWLQDVFPEVAAHLGVAFAQGWLGKRLQALRDVSLRKADCNIVLGERMRQLIESRGVDRSQMRVIHNWSDEDVIQPIPPQDNTLRQAWGLQDHFVVGYSGNLGRAHDWKTLLDAAEHLRGDQDIRFLFIGDGHGLVQLRAAAGERGLSNLEFRPYQARSALGLSLSVPDVHLVSLRPALEGLIVPSKIYGVLAAGRPAIFIGDPAGEVAQLLEQALCGHTVEEGDAEGLARHLRALKDQPYDRAAMGVRARQSLEQRWTRAKAFAAWQTLLAELG